jgi:outer membrane protein insertion porin family
VSEEQIRTNISIKTGDIFDRGAVDRDVRNLYNTGLFQSLRVAESAADEGVVLNYLVQEKPRISKIRFAGNTKFADADLAELLSSRVEKSLNERTLFDDAQKIRELYVKSGLLDAKVKFSWNANEDVGIGEVTFEITE